MNNAFKAWLSLALCLSTGYAFAEQTPNGNADSSASGELTFRAGAPLSDDVREDVVEFAKNFDNFDLSINYDDQGGYKVYYTSEELDENKKADNNAIVEMLTNIIKFDRADPEHTVAKAGLRLAHRFRDSNEAAEALVKKLLLVSRSTIMNLTEKNFEAYPEFAQWVDKNDIAQRSLDHGLEWVAGRHGAPTLMVNGKPTSWLLIRRDYKVEEDGTMPGFVLRETGLVELSEEIAKLEAEEQQEKEEEENDSSSGIHLATEYVPTYVDNPKIKNPMKVVKEAGDWEGAAFHPASKAFFSLSAWTNCQVVWDTEKNLSVQMLMPTTIADAKDGWDAHKEDYKAYGQCTFKVADAYKDLADGKESFQGRHQDESGKWVNDHDAFVTFIGKVADEIEKKDAEISANRPKAPKVTYSADSVNDDPLTAEEESQYGTWSAVNNSDFFHHSWNYAGLKGCQDIRNADDSSLLMMLTMPKKDKLYYSYNGESIDYWKGSEKEYLAYGECEFLPKPNILVLSKKQGQDFKKSYSGKEDLEGLKEYLSWAKKNMTQGGLVIGDATQTGTEMTYAEKTFGQWVSNVDGNPNKAIATHKDNWASGSTCAQLRKQAGMTDSYMFELEEGKPANWSSAKGSILAYTEGGSCVYQFHEKRDIDTGLRVRGPVTVTSYEAFEYEMLKRVYEDLESAVRTFDETRELQDDWVPGNGILSFIDIEGGDCIKNIAHEKASWDGDKALWSCTIKGNDPLGYSKGPVTHLSDGKEENKDENKAKMTTYLAGLKNSMGEMSNKLNELKAKLPEDYVEEDIQNIDDEGDTDENADTDTNGPTANSDEMTVKDALKELEAFDENASDLTSFTFPASFAQFVKIEGNTGNGISCAQYLASGSASWEGGLDKCTITRLFGDDKGEVIGDDESEMIIYLTELSELEPE